MDGQKFDRLTKHLAGATSRRQVIRGLGGGLVAALLTAAGREREVVAQTGNDDCAHFCNRVFPGGRARGACKSDAAHGVGLCHACNADVDRVCTAADGSRVCPDFQTDVNHCGTCGNACVSVPNGEPVCIGGECDVECALAADPCGGACCTEDQFCEADSCVPCREDGTACASEFECCSGVCDTYNGQCSPLL